MLNRLNAAFLELEKTRALVNGSCSLDELHQVINQLMCDLLAYSKTGAATAWGGRQAGNDDSLDELIESLADICIALFDYRGIPHERLLFLLDQALSRKMLLAAPSAH